MTVFIGSNELQYLDDFDMENKLFCTFSKKPDLDTTLEEITSHYNILYGKVFVLLSPESEEFMCTYNIELEDRSKPILPNTILLHRKKESNTLYTINSLNFIIKKLNDGVLDKNFKINWLDYKNSILLTQGSEFRKLNTLIHKIVSTQ